MKIQTIEDLARAVEAKARRMKTRDPRQIIWALRAEFSGLDSFEVRSRLTGMIGQSDDKVGEVVRFHWNKWAQVSLLLGWGDPGAEPKTKKPNESPVFNGIRGLGEVAV